MVMRWSLLCLSVVLLSVMVSCHAERVFAEDFSAHEAIYKKNCKRCHAMDGSGLKAGKMLGVAKSLFKKAGLSEAEQGKRLSLIDDDTKGKSDDQLKKAIMEGQEKMPAYAKKFTKQHKSGKIDVAADKAGDMMVQYIRHLQK